MLTALRSLHTPPAAGLTPYVRHFNGSSDKMAFGIGAITANPGGPRGACTLAVLLRRNANAVWHGIWELAKSTLDDCATMEISDTNTITYSYGTGVFTQSSAITVTTSDNWCIIGWTKTAGTSAPTFYKNILGGAFSTEAGASVVSSGAIADHVNVGFWQDDLGNTDWGNVDIAKAAYWDTSVLNSTQLQTLDDSDSAWLALSPTWAITLNQASTATSVPDDTGGGGGQTSITGTSVLTTGPALSGYGS